MVQRFEEIRTRTPTNPNEDAAEATMPQAAWKALLRDAVQGLRPPYTSQTLRQWIQTTNARAWAIGEPPPHPTATTLGRERARARGGQGTGRDTPAREQGRAQSDRQASSGTGHRERHNTGAGNHPWARKGKEQQSWRRERGHNRRHQGAQAGGASRNGGTSTAPPPANTARPPEAHAPNTRRRS